MQSFLTKERDVNMTNTAWSISTTREKPRLAIPLDLVTWDLEAKASKGSLLNVQRTYLEMCLAMNMNNTVLEESNIVYIYISNPQSSHSSPHTNDHQSYNHQQDFANDFMGGRGFGNFFTDFGFGGFGGGRVQDPFANDFFRNFGGMGGLPNMMSFGSMDGLNAGYGGTSQSVSTSTIIR